MDHGDLTGPGSFKRLADWVGIKKAMEIITTVEPPLAGDFSTEHKKMYTFSNDNTAAITRRLWERGDMADGKEPERIES